VTSCALLRGRWWWRYARRRACGCSGPAARPGTSATGRPPGARGHAAARCDGRGGHDGGGGPVGSGVQVTPVRPALLKFGTTKATQLIPIARRMVWCTRRVSESEAAGRDRGDRDRSPYGALRRGEARRWQRAYVAWRWTAASGSRAFSGPIGWSRVKSCSRGRSSASKGCCRRSSRRAVPGGRPDPSWCLRSSCSSADTRIV
jgi:hypothetical protein